MGNDKTSKKRNGIIGYDMRGEKYVLYTMWKRIER